MSSSMLIISLSRGGLERGLPSDWTLDIELVLSEYLILFSLLLINWDSEASLPNSHSSVTSAQTFKAFLKQCANFSRACLKQPAFRQALPQAANTLFLGRPDFVAISSANSHFSASRRDLTIWPGKRWNNLILKQICLLILEKIPIYSNEFY